MAEDNRHESHSPPAFGLESSLLNRFLPPQLLLFRLLLQILEAVSFIPDSGGEIAPNMLAILGEVVTLRSPELRALLLGNSCFDEEQEYVRKVRNMNVVPAGFTRANDGDVGGGED